MSRFTRQIRLAEVGEAGQAKLAAAGVRLATSGNARAIEEAYLRAAGVGLAEAGDARGTGERSEVGDPAGTDAAAAWSSLAIRHSAAGEVAAGAYAALLAMRAALGVNGA